MVAQKLGGGGATPACQPVCRVGIGRAPKGRFGKPCVPGVGRALHGREPSFPWGKLPPRCWRTKWGLEREWHGLGAPPF